MFQENLRRLVDGVEGGIAGLLMGFDGIAVDSYSRAGAPDPRTGPGGGGSLDIQTVGMEFSYILGQVRKAAEALEIGGVHEVAIRAEKLSVLLRIIDKDYFIALALTDEGNFGKGRYLLRVTAPRLQAELAA